MTNGKNQALEVEAVIMKKPDVTNERKPRILVVDDEESIRDTFDVFLTDQGYAVTIAPDGQSALAMARQHDFDVAVVDRILPDNVSGIEVIRDIKKQHPFCETILMSAYPSFESAAKILEHEAVAYLTKPVQQEEICRAVAFAAEKSRLKKEHERYESILQAFFDSSPNPIIVYDSLLQVQFVNPSFVELFEYSRNDVVGRPMLFAPEQAAPAILDEFQRLLRGETIREHELHMLCRSGKMLETTRIISLCSYLPDGSPAILVIISDISEAKKMQAQLVESEKLALLGQLAAKLAHEINNPMQVIAGYGELLLNEPLSDDLRSRISLMREAALVISGLTRDLMDVAKPKPMRITSFLLEQPLDKAADFLLKMGETKYLKVVKEYGSGAKSIQGDFNQLAQACMNLIVNAAYATKNTEKKMIRLTTDYDPDTKLMHLSVEDTGGGIMPENMDKIFDPFFTTKEAGVGNGLGLPVVKQIVERHGGAITVESRLGQGTTFHVTLPPGTEAGRDVHCQAIV
jgi:PAS domain S-box-containing protein